jgi:arginyl-tRNA synthetase
MIRTQLAHIFENAVAQLKLRGELPEAVPAIEIIETRDPSHGDFACNFALAASKAAGKPPRAIAEALTAEISTADLIASLEIAGPGFINIRLNPSEVGQFVARVLEVGDRLSHEAANDGKPKKNLNVEFVSVNPNGPITVGSGRGAALGSTLCNVFEAAGFGVHREYYINDGVNSEQMRQFAASVQSYVEGLPFPDKGYKGDYVQEVAQTISARQAGAQRLDWYQQESQTLMLERQRSDLASFAVEFDSWFSEQSLHDNGLVERDVAELEAKGAADTQPIRHKVKFAKGGVIEEIEIEEQTGVVDEDGEGDDSEPTPANPSPSEQPTLWLRSTKFGDDMDRVLRRKDGRLTYIASDVAYHKDKFNRGGKNGEKADKLITILGPDHHGYIGRLHAVVGALLEESEQQSNKSDQAELSELEAKLYSSAEERDACHRALAESKEKLEVLIFQIVRFVKDGKPAPMRKRDGNIYSLRDLMSEIGKMAAPEASEEEQMRIGKDVARFFYLMRSHETHMDFDIDLATKQSDENPVFYCQYAHARICSLLEKAKEAEFGETDRGDLSLLTHERETALIKKILDLPYEVQRCAEDYGVHRLTTYAQDLARTYHHFYDACRVIQPENRELTQARLNLCVATRHALKSVFNLLGVSDPERMERAPQAS